MLKPIRSFVRRGRRLSPNEQNAYSLYWPNIGLSIQEGIQNLSVPTILEIGFGSGDSLVEMAKTNPQMNYIGIEVHKPGIASLLYKMEQTHTWNIRIYDADAVEVVKTCFAPESLEGVQIFFPDPWPKRRHHKRRLIQPAFIDMLATKLKPNGFMHLATDWEDYGKSMMAVLSQSSMLKNAIGEAQFAPRSSHRLIPTKFEERGVKMGYAIWELQFVRC